MIHVILQVFCAIFSGLMEGLSISNEILLYGSPVLALFSLSPLYVALYSSKSYRESARLVAIQVLTVHMISSFWLANFRGFAILTLGASAFGTTLEAWLCGFFFYVLPSRLSKSKKLEENAGLHSFNSFFRIMAFSACWLFYEWIKSVGFLGYPWGTLPAAAYKFHLVTQIVDITGVWGITFIFAMFSGLVGEALLLLSNIYHSQAKSKVIESLKQCAILVFSVFGICTLYGIIQYNLPRNIEKQLDAVLVQQNIDPWEGGDESSISISKKLTEKKLEEMKDMGLYPDLVVWSEGVLERTFPNAASYYSRNPKDESLSNFIARMETPFIIGGTTVANQNKHHYYNSAILYDEVGSYTGFYSKIHLVPFAEAIPYQDNAIVKYILKKILGFSIGSTSGKQYVLFQIPLRENSAIPTPLEYREEEYPVITLDKRGRANIDTINHYTVNPDLNPDAYVSFTTPICFEDSFNDVCSKLYAAGSEVFINITNDSWSKTKSSEIQHFIESSYRALEYRTTLVRCANSGYTVVVNPVGKILADLPLFEEDALATTIPIYERQHTIYSICGDWFVKTVLIVFFAYVIFVAISLHVKKTNKDNGSSKKFKRIVIKFEYENTSSPDELDNSKNLITQEENKNKETLNSIELPDSTEKTSDTDTKPVKRSRKATAKSEPKKESKKTTKSSTKKVSEKKTEITTKSASKKTDSKSTAAKAGAKSTAKTVSKESQKKTSTKAKTSGSKKSK